jgi:hypothetical protein
LIGRPPGVVVQGFGMYSRLRSVILLFAVLSSWTDDIAIGCLPVAVPSAPDPLSREESQESWCDSPQDGEDQESAPANATILVPLPSLPIASWAAQVDPTSPSAPRHRLQLLMSLQR